MSPTEPDRASIRYGFCMEGLSYLHDDVMGHLLAPCDEHLEGWVVVASHISSNDSWAEHDIRKHFDRINEVRGGTLHFEWLGQVAGIDTLDVHVCRNSDHHDF